METLKTYELIGMPDYKVDEYWEDRVDQYKSLIKKAEESSQVIDPVLKNLSELIDLAVSLDQYKTASGEFNEVTRVLKLRINMPRKMIEKCFNLKTIGLYGVGLFAPVEGLLLSEGFRKKSGYDTCTKKRGFYDLSSVPEDIRNSYEFRLSIPANGGLFVPKKSDLTSWISRAGQLQFFDLTV